MQSVPKCQRQDCDGMKTMTALFIVCHMKLKLASLRIYAHTESTTLKHQRNNNVSSVELTLQT
eukprot:2100248-Amphidinium_carterae.1